MHECMDLLKDKRAQYYLIINSLMRITIFDGGLKRSGSRTGRLFMVPVLVISFYGNNKEGGNETKMKRLRGGEEACLLSDGTYIKQQQREGNENERGTAERRHQDYSIGLTNKRREKIFLQPLSLKGWKSEVACVCALGWQSLQCAG